MMKVAPSTGADFDDRLDGLLGLERERGEAVEEVVDSVAMMMFDCGLTVRSFMTNGIENFSTRGGPLVPQSDQ